jgi:hypothetical protein
MEMTVFGVGPRRDPELASEVAAIGRQQGWPQRYIIEYLALYGFVNLSGHVGRWNHRQFTKLALLYT